MIIGDTMETLKDYFSYEVDSSNVDRIIEDLSRQLKMIHERGAVIRPLSCDSIVYDNKFYFDSLNKPVDFNSEKKENILTLSKIMIGAYMSVGAGFRDLSCVDSKWFAENIEDICSSVGISEYNKEYLMSIFLSNSNLYYCDFLDNHRQKERLQGSGNIQTYTKVLRTAASELYQDQSLLPPESISEEKKNASINIIFYPLLVGSIMIFALVILLLNM